MLQHIIINSLIIIGIHITCWPDMLFEAIANELDGLLPPWLRKPLYDCVMCMSSIWGFSYLLCIHPNCIDSVLKVIAHILAVCGINAIINYLVLIPAKDKINGNNEQIFNSGAK